MSRAMLRNLFESSTARATWIAGLLVAVSGDYLLRAPPGLNTPVLYLGLYLAMWWVAERAGVPLSREAHALLSIGVLFAAGKVWRDSELLALLSFLAASAAFAAPALNRGRAWLVRGQLGDQIEAMVGACAYAALGSLRLIFGRSPGTDSNVPTDVPSGRDALADLNPKTGSPRLAQVLRGAVVAAPLLVVFGALFASADRVFAELASSLFRIDLRPLASHVVLIGLLAWLVCGYLTGLVNGTRMPDLRRLPVVREATAPGTLGIVEVGTALLLVDALFLAFVAVQLRYLFGGSDLVGVTPGLTYSEYARQGFEQLAFASALVVPSLLAADFALRRESARDGRVFGLLGGLQLALLIVILASAAARLRAYEAAYGLTVSRFFGAAFLVWLVMVSALFAGTVLRGRRERFAFFSLGATLAVVAGLHAVNPEAVIVRASAARVTAGGVEAPAPLPAIDGAYLASLGADAAPALIEAIPELPQPARCLVAESLLDRWENVPNRDWRSWSWSRARARAEVRAHLPELREAVAGAPCR